MSERTPTLLLILDGWGLAPEETSRAETNAVCSAQTPTLDRLIRDYPTTSLACSGRAVGLPEGFMGNSEVGHMNLGAGRVIYQDMTRIDLAIEEKRLGENQTLLDLFAAAKAGSGRVHFMGLCSDGGVHSHLNHLKALLALTKEQGLTALVHCFMDGRDTPPSSGKDYLAELQHFLDETGTGQIASVVGRFYAMDRDKRYERNQIAYEMLTEGKGSAHASAQDAIEAAYAAGETDEFVTPRLIGDPKKARLADDDALFFFNFRADRARQISRALFDDGFDGFTRTVRPTLATFATMTRYESSFPLAAAFPPEEYTDTLGETVSKLGLTQLRIAETEKYAHVTYFFNCGLEDPFPGEERTLVPSPREVRTYDEKPEMSAEDVTDQLIARLGERPLSLAVCNLANLDMVGHTGIFEAAVAACQTVDGCVEKIVQTMLDLGGRVLLTADHGNAETMQDETGQPHTAHTTNPVPLVLIENTPDGKPMPRSLAPGKLGDIAPTILDLWGETIPPAMTGTSLIR